MEKLNRKRMENKEKENEWITIDDKLIEPFINLLNQQGYKTMHCCCGHTPEEKDSWGVAYIGFENNLKNYSLITEILDMFDIPVEKRAGYISTYQGGKGVSLRIPHLRLKKFTAKDRDGVWRFIERNFKEKRGL